MDPYTTDQWRQIIEAWEMPATELVLLRDFLRTFPDSGPALMKYGMLLVDMSRLEEAETIHRKVLDISRGRMRVMSLINLGTLSVRKGELAAAGEWFRQAIDCDPNDTDGYVYLGGLLARIGRTAEAEAIHRRGTLCTHGCVDEAHLNLGLVLRAMERYPEALECFDRALQIDPHYAEARQAHRDVKRALTILAETAHAK